MQNPPLSYTYAVSNPCRCAFAFATLHDTRTPCKENKIRLTADAIKYAGNAMLQTVTRANTRISGLLGPTT